MHCIPERAMVFAAGLGTRMGELTRNTPKPLIRVAGKPLLDYALERFEQIGCSRIVVNCHYQAEQIISHLEKRPSRTEIVPSHEAILLETGGGVVHALPQLGSDPFFSANSDTIWIDADVPALERLARAFDPTRFDAMLLLHPLSRAVGYRGPGNFDLSANGELLRNAAAAHVFTGVQILHPRLFADRQPEPFSLREIYRARERPDGGLTRIGGLVHDGDWLHVGTQEELREAERWLS